MFRSLMFRGVCLLLAGLALSSLPSAATDAAKDAAKNTAAPRASDALQRILSLGPWPPAVRPDPGNRVSGRVRAIELGRRLFRDSRMSPVGYIACVTCHQPDRSFTDIKARAHGLADLPRNTPALANLRQQHWYGWGGSSDSLWMASIRPMLDPREFDGNATSVTAIFRRDPDLAACYRRVFHASPFGDPTRTVVNVGKALAAFVETMVTERTPFDDYRDALARGDAASDGAYPPAAQRGLQLFVGQGGCSGCHSGPNLSDGEFHPGDPRRDAGGDTSGAAIALVASSSPAFAFDNGRLDSARELKASPWNLLGPHNDDPSRANAAATRRLRVDDAMQGQFRTPSLRNVTVTGPYMHDGHVDQLRDAIRHASRNPGSGAAQLSDEQVADLAAFLATLTDRYGERRPWVTESKVACK